MGDDAAMLDIVTSASIACGFHAGDPTGILGTLRAAAARGVAWLSGPMSSTAIWPGSGGGRWMSAPRI
nr:LamB/YcsF family protein [Frigidibacter albus]